MAAARVTGCLLACGVARCVCLAGEVNDTSEVSDGLEKDELCRLDAPSGVLVVVREALISRVSPPGMERSNSDCVSIRS